jgi:hypothetical protein
VRVRHDALPPIELPEHVDPFTVELGLSDPQLPGAIDVLE